MTLKLAGDLDILKMYLHTKDEVARFRCSKLITVDEICMVNEENTTIALRVKGQRSDVTNF